MANLVTIGRIALLFVAIAFVYTGEAGPTALAALVTALVIFGDAVDGWVARAWSRPTVFGSIFDIAGDRIVENAYWIVFAHLGLVPIWVPLVLICRSFLVDAVRSLALIEGKTAFGESTMMRSRLGVWVASSRFSRATYGVAKAIVFCTVLIQLALERAIGDAAFAQGGPLAALAVANLILVYFVVGFGLLRGIMVLYDTRAKIFAS
jgi:CDP-diacylglycerol--glycerol-3-phosphate 3-phosphatidyltransferase